jgi:beta-glucosidase
MNTSKSPLERIDLLLANMTTTQKIHLMAGSFNSEGYVGFVSAIPELKIPAVTLNDGPQGYRSPDHPRTSTAWPSGMTIGASFDVSLAREWGVAMGKEFFAKGSNVLLGPAMNVARVPQNGRNFEYISGEDPLLGAAMAGPIIQGIQSTGIVANAKHWVQNNQETDRGPVEGVNEVVDERTQWEIYYPPFEAAVNAGVGSFMCSYNKINGKYACESEEALNRDLKDRLGFDGWVMSDWGATHGLTDVGAGLDQEMPDPLFLSETSVQAGLLVGAVKKQQIDEAARRILTPLMRVGAFDNMDPQGSPARNVTSPESDALARKFAAACTVMLKNDGGVLPIAPTGAKVAVLGKQARDPIVHGGGSGGVIPAHTSAPYEALQARLGGGMLFGDEDDLDAAIKVATVADLAVVFVATSSTEGFDRGSLSLPKDQEKLVFAIAAVQPKTVVVVVTPGAVLTPWRDDVAAILVPFQPGQEYGNAVSDILFGDVNPSARLHTTMPKVENEMNMSKSQWPGVGGMFGLGKTATYSEKLEVGYRWYSAHGVIPAFPFGHGLSYAAFEYSHLDITTNAVAFDVTNVGKVTGDEVAQVYVTFPKSANEPPKQLKGFTKIQLNPREKKTVTINLSTRVFSIWDVSKHAWSEVRGKFKVEVGASSADIRLAGDLNRGSVLTV